jgi:CBS domain-containing protein
VIRIVGAETQKTKTACDRQLIGAPMGIGDIMTRTMITLSPNQSMADAATMLNRHPFRHFLIVDAAGKLAGVISDRDILRAYTAESGCQAHPISEFMTSNVICVTEATPLSVAAEMMVTQRINFLPVVNDGGSVTGVVTSIDLLKTYRRVQQSIDRTAHL